MSSPMHSHDRDPAGTYVQQSRLTDEELALFKRQEQIMIAALGGVLPEQRDPISFESVLDVGSGTGQWLIELAKTYPTIPYLVGVDINAKLVEYAQAQAAEQQVADRVQFRTMDALGFLDFPADTFDLINLSMGGSFLRTWEWNGLLHNFQRIARPEGVVRLVEADVIDTNSVAMMRRRELLLQAFYQSGHFFRPQEDGLTSEIVPLLHRLRFQNVQSYPHTLYYREGTLEAELFATYLEQAPRSILQFIQKWMRLSEDDRATTSEQMFTDMQRPDFMAKWHLLIAWGNKPLN